MELLRTAEIIRDRLDVINNAKKKLMLASPFIQFSEDEFYALKNALKRGVKVCIAYGKNRNIQEETDFDFEELEEDGAYVFYVDNLHAKYIMNENEAVYGSMNNYEASENNIEIGEHIYRKSSPEHFIKLETIVRETFNSSETSFENNIKRCQRCKICHKSIPYNPRKPYCYDCFIDLVDDDYYPEKRPFYRRKMSYCKICKCPIPYDPSKPFCYDCYKTKVEKQSYHNDYYGRGYGRSYYRGGYRRSKWNSWW